MRDLFDRPLRLVAFLFLAAMALVAFGGPAQAHNGRNGHGNGHGNHHGHGRPLVIRPVVALNPVGFGAGAYCAPLSGFGFGSGYSSGYGYSYRQSVPQPPIVTVTVPAPPPQPVGLPAPVGDPVPVPVPAPPPLVYDPCPTPLGAGITYGNAYQFGNAFLGASAGYGYGGVSYVGTQFFGLDRFGRFGNGNGHHRHGNGNGNGNGFDGRDVRRAFNQGVRQGQQSRGRILPFRR